MTLTFWNIMIPALSGLIGVALGAFKPFWEWHIESKKLRYNERKLFIKRIRDVVTSPKFREYNFGLTAEYSQLRPHMPENMIRKFEFNEDMPNTDIVVELLKLVRDLEIKWNLL